MSIMARIRVFQAILVIAVVAIAATAVISLRGANHYIERVQISRRQVDAMTELALRANRFSEQIAELLLVGEPERPEFEDSRRKMLAQFDALRRSIEQEDDLFQDPANDAEEREEAGRLDRMRQLVRAIDRTVERILLLDQQGRREEAISLFRAEIENRYDKELESLIDVAVADEREDVAEADALAQSMSRTLLYSFLAALAGLLALIVTAGVLFARSLRKPIDALVEGTRAVEQGDLAHRVVYDRTDEFGVLAQRFNAMSTRLEAHRRDLTAARDTLERQVEERTQEIASANRQLTELDRQRVRFFGDISHELKTPLTVLRAEAELALRGPSRPESVYRSALESVVAQAASMSDLVDDLLFLARSDADEIRFEFRSVSLDGAVEQAVQDASVLSRSRGIRIVWRCPKPAPVVRADLRRLKQALLVMLDNSVRYADEDSEVAVDVRPAEGGRVEITVRDRGAGIPVEEAPFVFDRFYRGSAAMEGVVGNGLGLPIARWIVEKHDGDITLTSTPGQGTEVRVSLPLAA
jgi:two-component system OmpR family sensor kinase